MVQKTLVDKTVGTLSEIKAVALKSYPCEEVKQMHVTKIFHETKWEDCVRHLCCALKYNGWLSWKQALGQSFELWVNVGTFLEIALFTWKNDI